MLNVQQYYKSTSTMVNTEVDYYPACMHKVICPSISLRLEKLTDTALARSRQPVQTLRNCYKKKTRSTKFQFVLVLLVLINLVLISSIWDSNFIHGQYFILIARCLDECLIFCGATFSLNFNNPKCTTPRNLNGSIDRLLVTLPFH